MPAQRRVYACGGAGAMGRGGAVEGWGMGTALLLFVFMIFCFQVMDRTLSSKGETPCSADRSASRTSSSILWRQSTHQQSFLGQNCVSIEGCSGTTHSSQTSHTLPHLFIHSFLCLQCFGPHKRARNQHLSHGNKFWRPERQVSILPHSKLR